MPEKLSKRGKNLQVYVIMKLGLDAAAYDGLGFGANFKRHIKKRKLWFWLNSFREAAMKCKMDMKLILIFHPGTSYLWWITQGLNAAENG